MNHKQAREWIELALLDELMDADRLLLDEHLASCDECRRELAAAKKFHDYIRVAEPGMAVDLILAEARIRLRSALQRGRADRRPGTGQWTVLLSSAFQRYRVPLGLAACLVFGVVLGGVWKSLPTGFQTSTRQAGPMSVADGETRIGDVRFLKNDPATGEIEFAFDAVKSMRITGNITELRIQKILAQALLMEHNAGVRLQSVSAIASRGQLDNEVKSALVTAVKSDDNAGVRQEALKALRSYVFDEEVKQAFLFVLTHEKNPGLRIAAINYLDSAKVMVHGMDQQILRVLKEKSESDNNNYIRLRARTVLEEINQ